MGGVLLAGGEGLPEEILAGRFILARGLMEGCAFLPFGHLPGFPSYKGHCPGLGGPLVPPRKESQQAVCLYFCHFLHQPLADAIPLAWSASPVHCPLGLALFSI